MNFWTNDPLSLTMTDAYKASMAEAGFPLRDEVFYGSHRKGGWQFVPLDIETHIKNLLPTPTPEAFAYLDTHGYSLGAGSRAAAAMKDHVQVRALSKGTWFHDKEPIFSVEGPSFMASWLEPMALQINRRIQIATAALLRPDTLASYVENATCEEERQITLETLDSVGVAAPTITVREDDYYTAVRERAERLVQIVGDPDRIFEVGLRAVSCMGQHMIALRAIRDAGILRTSNMYGAAKLGMIPVGTMGHEHIQRYGSSYAAFCAMRDRVPGFLSYLPDTFNTLAEGIPSALQAMSEAPDRDAAIRFDAEARIREQYAASIEMARSRNLDPRWFLESSWNDVKTIEFETLREVFKILPSRQGYGIGGFMVDAPWKHFRRDDVSAVYKLSKSLRGVQKMGDEPGAAKESIGGDLVLWRPHLGMAGYDGPVGYVAQRGENWKPPVPASLLTGTTGSPAVNFSVRDIQEFNRRAVNFAPLALSPETQRIREQCYRRRADAIATAAEFSGRL